jgi:prepilin-type processing-associated H-X9-DG protein
VPSDTFFMAECAEAHASSDHFHLASADAEASAPQSFAAGIAVTRHSSAANYLLVDGHVEWIKWQTLQHRLTQAGCRFVNPSGRGL